MEGLEFLGRSADQLDRLVDNVKPEQLDEQTLCTDWKVRDLLNHLAAGGQIFALSAEQGSVPDEEMGRLMSTDQLGDDYKTSLRSVTGRVKTAFAQPGVLDKVVKLPFAELPAAAAMNIAALDVTIHCCDLARATGQHVDDDELLQTALASARQTISPEFRQPGTFDAERTTSSEGAEDRLLAFAGRHV